MIKVVSNKEQTATGPLPMTFDSDGTPLTGYKLYGTSEGSGAETENLVPEIRISNGWRPGYLSGNDGHYISNNPQGEWLSPFIELNSITAVSILFKPVDKNPSLSIYFFNANDEYISYKGTLNNGQAVFSNFPSGATKICYAYRTKHGTEQEVIQNEDWTCLVAGSVLLDHYIPHGYKLPMTVESGEKSTTTPIYIGNSKLGEEEYVDYGEQKVYRIVGGVLTPTDLPVLLPELSIYQGENTLSCSEALGDESQITYVGPVEETITKIMRTEDDGQGNVTEHVLYKEGS